MKRVVVPEILDHLPHDDPEAVRARVDLERINWLMGNHRWLRRELSGFEGDTILELGAGDGELLASLSRNHNSLTGLDLVPRPNGLPNRIDWITGDLFETLPGELKKDSGKIAIMANLFLHHFENDSLARIGKLIQGATLLCFSEPFRSRLPLAQSALLYPFINRVTRHDMPVSIRAGFRQGELPDLLDLQSKEWQIREHVSGFGAYRLVATKRQ